MTSAGLRLLLTFWCSLAIDAWVVNRWRFVLAGVRRWARPHESAPGSHNPRRALGDLDVFSCVSTTSRGRGSRRLGRRRGGEVREGRGHWTRTRRRDEVEGPAESYSLTAVATSSCFRNDNGAGRSPTIRRPMSRRSGGVEASLSLRRVRVDSTTTHRQSTEAVHSVHLACPERVLGGVRTPHRPHRPHPNPPSRYPPKSTAWPSDERRR